MPKEPIQIRLASVYVPFVGTINTKENTFNARVDVDMMWPATAEDLKNFAADEKHYKPSFNPDLVVQNAANLNLRQIPGVNANPYTIKMASKENFVRVRCEGSFICSFELTRFPFDIQDLKMSFALSFVDASEAVLVVSPEATSFVCLTRYTALTEWVFVRLAAFSEIKEGFSYATASLIVKRKPDIYLKKLGVFAVVPNYGTLLAFAHDAYGEQIRVLLTMMLALTAILFVLQNMVSCVKYIFFRSGL